MNPNAQPFSFNAGANTFVPGGAAAAPAPAPVVEPVVEAAPAPAPVAAAPAAVAEPVKENWDDDDTPAPAEVPAPSAQKEATVEQVTEKIAEVTVTPTPAPTPAKVEKKEEKVEKVEKVVEKSNKSSKKSKEKEEYKVHDEREHLNVVFIGHVDAGKSTISGQILLLTNQVDERTIQKYKKEAQEKKRDTWYLAYVMDTNEEEKDKGKTVEVGRAKFSTANKRYTLLDAPGHSKYVPNMIEGTAQADVGILVISARKGEFEAGFDKGGQTREHAMLAKTLGIQKLIVLVNKMDEKTVKWSEERYNQIQSKLSPFLKRWGYNVKKDVTFVPSSGYTGANLRDRVEPSMCPWYKGESLFQTLDGMDSLERDPKAPMRLPVVARYKDRGTLCVLGKLESGSCQIGDELMLMPTKKKITCVGMMVDDEEVNIARPGENLVLKVKGCEEEDILGGFVVCDSARPCPRSKKFNAQIQVLGLLEHKPLITAGYSAILHTHSLSCEVDITTLVAEINKKTGKKTGRPRFLKRGAIGLVTFETKQTIAIESFKNNAQLGRFTIRDEGKTIAIGKVVAMKEE